MSNIAVASAIAQLGKPYAWNTPTDFNAPNPNTFDCSGLTGWCYKRAGYSIAHYTVTQYAQLKHRPLANAQPGDLVFFQDRTGMIYHVGMYVGNGQMIEAPDYGIPVRYRNVSASTPDIMFNVGAYPGTQVDSTITGITTADAIQNAGTIPTASTTGGLIPTSVGTLVKFISTASNWQRAGLALLGALILAFTLKEVL